MQKQHYRNREGLEVIFERNNHTRWVDQVEYRMLGDSNIYVMDRKAFHLQFKPVVEVRG